MTATVQAVGTHIQIRLRAASDVLVRLPADEWETSRELKRSLTHGRVHLSRWGDALRKRTDGNDVVLPGVVEVLQR